MKILKLFIYGFLLFIVALIVFVGHDISSGVQKPYAKPFKLRLPDLKNYNPLTLPDTSTPEKTLVSFINNSIIAYSLSYKSYSEDRKTSGFFSSPKSKYYRPFIKGYMRRAAACLNLSEVSQASRQKVAAEDVIMLKEIIDRIKLPFSKAFYASEEPHSDHVQGLKLPGNWRIPGTNITVGKVMQGPNAGRYLFTPTTVKNIPKYYQAVKNMPYQSRSNVTPGIYTFYSVAPGGIVSPPKWFRMLPSWLHYVFQGEAMWQWLLIILSFIITIILFLMPFKIVKVCKPLSQLKLYVLKASLALFSLMAMSYLLFFLESWVNVTGVIFSGCQIILFIFIYTLIVVTFLSVCSVISAVTISKLHLLKGSIQASSIRSIELVVKTLSSIGIIIYALYYLGVSLMPLLTSLGLAGLAVAIAMRSILGNIIGSFVLFFDKPYGVGDIVDLNGEIGVVETIGLRSTGIRLKSGPLLVVPNGKATASISHNYTRQNHITKEMIIYIKQDTPAEKIKQAVSILENITSMPGSDHEQHEQSENPHINASINFNDKLPVVLFKGFSKGAVLLTLTYCYHPPIWEEYVKYASWLNTTISDEFEKAGIELA